jgi:glycosyltransferase involved in cell wall biosynthesis
MQPGEPSIAVKAFVLGAVTTMGQSQCLAVIRRVGLVGTFLPRRCGIGVFNTSLGEAVAALLAPEGKVCVVAVNDTPEGYHYPEQVLFEVSADVPQDYRHAAEFLNMHEVDGVILQHEFGLYGGPAGSHVLRLLRELHMPVLVVLHNVLERPTTDQRAVIAQMTQLSDRFVVMTERARAMLDEIYGIDPGKIACIPHGIPDMPLVDPDIHKEDVGLASRQVILTYGLIAPGKGIEHMIDAMPAVVDRHPEAIYVVLGVTHPVLKVQRGEEYRQGLYQQVRQMGLEPHVTFRSRFASREELRWYLTAADVCVTPYLGEKQVTSGVLANMMGSGNAVVSTPYWYAREMLADGRGLLVPFGDSEALTRQVNGLLEDDQRRDQVRRKAYAFTRIMTWPKVARQYLNLLGEVVQDRGRSARRIVSLVDSMSWGEIVPELDFRHLQIMTDGVGLTQHAVYAIPDRRFGYCTDDNARALTVAMWQWDLRKDPQVQPLISQYLAFLVHAFNEERHRFRNFMSYSRQWLEEVGSEDSHARAILACGVTAELSPYESTLGLAVRLFKDALPAVEDFTWPRSWAFTIVGLDSYLRRFPEDADAQRMLERLGARLLARYQRVGHSDWPFVEESLTWGNARVPHGLLVAGARLDVPEMIETALTSLHWLLRIQTAPAGHLSVIGNQGWYVRGGHRAVFDQQPVEVMDLAEACSAAYRLTGDRAWLIEIRRCLEWFLGRNDQGLSLYDYSTGGCRDGLHSTGVNANQGAESTLAWLTTLLIVHRLQVRETLYFRESSDRSLELQNREI